MYSQILRKLQTEMVCTMRKQPEPINLEGLVTRLGLCFGEKEVTIPSTVLMIQHLLSKGAKSVEVIQADTNHGPLSLIKQDEIAKKVITDTTAADSAPTLETLQKPLAQALNDAGYEFKLAVLAQLPTELQSRISFLQWHEFTAQHATGYHNTLMALQAFYTSNTEAANCIENTNTTHTTQTQTRKNTTY